jgi:chaperonin GroEL
MQRGINQMVDVVCPTLGPFPRVVAIAQVLSDKMPELLDDGGVIARRIIQLADRDEDMGAMFVRHLLWHLHEKVGDGTATAAVLFRSIYNQGVRYITAGGNAMRLSRYLQESLQVIVDALTGMTIRLEGEDNLAKIAESICYDPPLAKMLGEIFNIIGEYGRLEVRSGRGRELEREYVEGMYWDGGVHSRLMIENQPELRVDIEDAAVLISDFEIEDPRELVPIVLSVAEAEIPSMLVIASKLSDGVTRMMMAANKNPDKLRVIAAKTPGSNKYSRAAALEDVAVLTGGRALTKAAGYKASATRIEDLGRARKVWVDRSYFGVVGGKGDARTLRKHIADLRAAFGKEEDPDARKKLRERIGKLMGGSAVLMVGGASELEIQRRRELAERTADALRGAIMEGVLPGGGVSLLACRPVLQEMMEQSAEPDGRAAYRILIRAFEEPIRTILTNAGYDASEVMAEIKQAGIGYGFDVRSREVVDMMEAGIFDVANVVKEAVRSGIGGAALALTVDVLVHHKDFDDKVESAYKT